MSQGKYSSATSTCYEPEQLLQFKAQNALSLAHPSLQLQGKSRR